MRLNGFRVTNFRSVSDSGDIAVGQRTALVGRNESGKTNILLALEALNPPGGRKALLWVKDFPRDRRRGEFNETLPVVSTVWELDEADRAELGKLFPRAKSVTHVTVIRNYTTTLRYRFEGLPALAVDVKDINERLKTLKASVQASSRTLPDSSPVHLATDALQKALTTNVDAPATWLLVASGAINAFEAAATLAGLALTQNASAALTGLRTSIAEFENDGAAFAAALVWVAKVLPTMIYIEDYPEVEGHQNLSEFLEHQTGGNLSSAEGNFAKLMKVAELDPKELQTLLAQDHEERQQLTNRASALVSATIRRLWTDRQLTVRFNVDAEHMDTLVADPNAVYPTEINLNERSRGFQWFFSFYVTFAADTMGGPAEKAILLFDEPGLHLHATAQRDLLRQFDTELVNQILYTTHSPFMIPVNDISSVRTVNIAQGAGTTVTNDPTGDSKTLFPLQAALGFEIAQTLFVGPANLIVEGVTDFWYISAINEHLRDKRGLYLPTNVAITPAGGSSKVTYLVSLLSSQDLQVVVLLDDEPDAQQQAREISRSKLLRDDYILFASSAFEEPPRGGCDIEDLIDAAVFRQLVEESYKSELVGKTLELNADIPRTVKRYEEGFSRIGLDFNKTRPAKLFLRRVAVDSEAALPPECIARFERLFTKVNASFETISRRNAGSFR